MMSFVVHVFSIKLQILLNLAHSILNKLLYSSVNIFNLFPTVPLHSTKRVGVFFPFTVQKL